jgi:hypothetical protein
VKLASLLWSAGSVAVLLSAAHTAACPCSDDPGAGELLTRRDQRYALVLATSSRLSLGSFDAQGKFRTLSAAERETSEELLFRAALRLPQRFEWQLEAGAAAYRFDSEAHSEHQQGQGDAIVRALYAASEQAMPHAALPWPALSLGLLLRAPLGAIASSRPGGFGSGGAPLGLGAWEAGGGFSLTYTTPSSLGVWLGTEAAHRFPDDVLGRRRRLGTRWDTQAGARLDLAGWLRARVALQLRLTGDVSLSGKVLEGTSQRLVTALFGVAAQHAGFRGGIGLSIDPPFSGLSAGSAATTALSCSLGFAH